MTSAQGFDALEYREHADYSVVQSTNPDLNKAVVRILIASRLHPDCMPITSR